MCVALSIVPDVGRGYVATPVSMLPLVRGVKKYVYRAEY